MIKAINATAKNPQVLSAARRAAILSKEKNHDWGRDGFCIHGCLCHRTDLFRPNDLCPKKFESGEIPE